MVHGDGRATLLVRHESVGRGEIVEVLRRHWPDAQVQGVPGLEPWDRGCRGTRSCEARSGTPSDRRDGPAVLWCLLRSAGNGSRTGTDAGSVLAQYRRCWVALPTDCSECRW
jgi:hypothetical protein